MISVKRLSQEAVSASIALLASALLHISSLINLTPNSGLTIAVLHDAAGKSLRIMLRFCKSRQLTNMRWFKPSRMSTLQMDDPRPHIVDRRSTAVPMERARLLQAVIIVVPGPLAWIPKPLAISADIIDCDAPVSGRHVRINGVRLGAATHKSTKGHGLLAVIVTWLHSGV